MEIRPNRVKQKLADGDLAYVISGLTSADDIDTFGPNGYDGVGWKVNTDEWTQPNSEI